MRRTWQRDRFSAWFYAAVSVAAIIGSALVVAACGGDSAADETEPTPRASATARIATPTASADDASPTPGTPQETPATPTSVAGEPTTAPAPPASPTVAVPPPASPTTAPPPPPPPSGTTLTVLGQAGKFVPAGISAGANAPLTIIFNNVDDGIAHDIRFTRDGSPVANSEIIVGPAQTSVTFTPLAGTYKIICSIHARTMGGTLTVQ